MSSSPSRAIHRGHAIYLGKVKGQQAIRHGEGQSFYPECGGDMFHFEGLYTQGVKTKGKFTFKGHSTYEGEYDVDNKSGEIEGIGTKTWEDGRKYTGKFAHGEMNGEGKWTSANGEEVYEGNHYENKRQGMGVLTKVVGSDTHIYNGPFEGHQYHGRGTYVVRDMAAATCTFHHGIMQGACEVTWDKCSKFKGFMENGMFTSHGSYRSFSDAYIFEGQFSKGLPNKGYSTAITATLDRSEISDDAHMDPKAKKPPPPKKGSEPEEEFAAVLGPGDLIGDFKVILSMQEGPEELLASLQEELAEAQAEKKPDVDKIKALEDKISVLKLTVAALNGKSGGGGRANKGDGDNEIVDAAVESKEDGEDKLIERLNSQENIKGKLQKELGTTWTREIRRRLSLRLLAVDPETSEVATENTPICVVPMTDEEKASSYSRFASAIRCYVSGTDVQNAKPESAAELILDDHEGTLVAKVCDEWLGLSNVHQLSAGAFLKVTHSNMEALERNGQNAMHYMVDFALDLVETVRSLNSLQDVPEFVEMTIMTLDYDSSSKNDVFSLELKFPMSEINHLLTNLSSEMHEDMEEGKEGDGEPLVDSIDTADDPEKKIVLPVANIQNCMWRVMITHEPDDIDELPDLRPPVGMIKITKITCVDTGEGVNRVMLRCGHSVASTTTTAQEPVELPWNGASSLIVKVVDQDDGSKEKGDVHIHLPTLSLFENPFAASVVDMELEHTISTSFGAKITVDAEFIPVDPVLGTLSVKIVSCSELVAADARKFTALSDPFVRVTLGYDQKSTTSKDNDLNPVYNETLTFDWNGKEKLTINVLDDDENKEDDPIGDLSNIDLNELNLLDNLQSDSGDGEDEKVDGNGNRIVSFFDVELKNENPVNPNIKYMHGMISYQLSLEKNPSHFWPKEEAEKRYAEYLAEEDIKLNAQPPKREVASWVGGGALSTDRWHSAVLMVSPNDISFHLDGNARLRTTCQVNNNNHNYNETDHNNAKIPKMLPIISENLDANTEFFVGGEGFNGYVKSIAVFGESDQIDPMKLTGCFEIDEVNDMKKGENLSKERKVEEEQGEVKEEKERDREVDDAAVEETKEPTLPVSHNFEFDSCVGVGRTSALRLRLPADIKDGVYVVEITDAIEHPCRLSAEMFNAAATAREEEAAAANASASDVESEEIVEGAKQESLTVSIEEKKEVIKPPTEISGMVSMVHEMQSFRELRIKVERNIVV